MNIVFGQWSLYIVHFIIKLPNFFKANLGKVSNSRYQIIYHLIEKFVTFAYIMRHNTSDNALITHTVLSRIILLYYVRL